MHEISNMDDIIDTRNLKARLNELEDSLHDDYEEAKDECFDDWVAEQAEEGNEIADRYHNKNEVELKNELKDAYEESNHFKSFEDWLETECEDDIEDYNLLKEFAEECEATFGRSYDDGVLLVRESYFTEYCEELTKEIGDMPDEIPSYLVIDWEATADNLKVDYSGVYFGKILYYGRE